MGGKDDQRGQLIKGSETLNPSGNKGDQGNKGNPSDVHQKTPKNHHSSNSTTTIRRNPLPIIHISIKEMKQQ